jgi:hypothetical protein
MCQSKAQGGQRCYTHAARRFLLASAALQVSSGVRDWDNEKSVKKIEKAEARFLDAAAALASTDQGEAEITQLRDQQFLEGNRDQADMLNDALIAGKMRRKRSAKIAEEYKARGGTKQRLVSWWKENKGAKQRVSAAATWAANNGVGHAMIAGSSANLAASASNPVASKLLIAGASYSAATAVLRHVGYRNKEYNDRVAHLGREMAGHTATARQVGNEIKYETELRDSQQAKGPNRDPAVRAAFEKLQAAAAESGIIMEPHPGFTYR